MTDLADVLTIAKEVAEVSRLSDGDDLAGVLQRYVDRLVRTVPGCDHASITVAEDDGIETIAGTEEADLVDRRGVLAPGPIREALSYGEPRRLVDTESDQRWPEFSARLVKAGYRSAVVLPIAAQTSPAAALTLFARKPDQFGESSYDVVLLFTLNAGVAFDNASLYHESQQLVNHLRTALSTRATIGQAQGILMHRHGYDPDRAFTALRQSSQHLNLKLRDLATELVKANAEGQVERVLHRFYLS